MFCQVLPDPFLAVPGLSQNSAVRQSSESAHTKETAPQYTTDGTDTEFSMPRLSGHTVTVTYNQMTKF